MTIDVHSQKPVHPTISAHRVEGSAVYNLDGEWIGRVEDLLIEKVSGQVTCAIVSYGAGPLNTGGGRHPVPWECLSYDVGRRGYKVDEERLRSSFSLMGDDYVSDLSWRERAYGHWAARPYWYGLRSRG